MSLIPSKHLRSRTIYQGRVIEVESRTLQLGDGHIGEYDVVNHPGAAAVVPIDAERHVYLVRQERWAVGATTLELPAGRRDADESMAVCAARELEEEIGYRAKTLSELGPIYTTPGFCGEVIGLYLAQDLVRTQQRLDPHEHLEVVRMPLAEAVRMAHDNRLQDAKTVIGLLRAAARLG